MSARQEHKTITDNDGNEHKYFVIQKPAMQGEILKFELINLLGPSVGKIKDVTKEEQGLQVFGDIIKTIFETTDPDEVVNWLQKLVLNISRDKQRITIENFDEIYTDNMLEFYKACAFVLEVNFGNFFRGLNLGATLTKMKNLAT